MRLLGKVAVITGAAGTLGSELAVRFREEGCAGTVLTDIEGPSLEECRRRHSGDDVLVVPADIRNQSSVAAVVAAAVDRFGRLDVMINNAGVLAPNARLHRLSLEDWRRVIDVNLLGVVNGTTVAIEVMREQGFGSIINTASVAGVVAWSHSGPYCATKAAVIQLTKVTALEYAPAGLRANCVCPGSFASGMFEGVPDAALDAISARHPLGLGTPADLVGAYVFLASDESRWMTGASMVVDGGYSVP